MDHVLDTKASQETTFATVGNNIIDHCLAGYNSSVFCYGQTGSGKTHTMMGSIGREADGGLSPGCGLIPRVFESLFTSVAQREQQQESSMVRYSVKCSFLEIYNEDITDLLEPTSTGLQIRDGDVKKGVYVQGLSEHEVLNADDVLALIVAGSENRRMAATKMNERSSRSHSVFTATVECHQHGGNGGEHGKYASTSGTTPTPTTTSMVTRYSKINLIDLAGSERVGRSGAAGQQLVEAKSINRSLAVLGRVIAALVERQRRPSIHIPYRDSRLTFLLQESLGGNSKTCIVANITPAVDSVAETYSTLTFATNCKKIKCRAVVNEDRMSNGNGAAYAEEIKALSAENGLLAKMVGDLKQQLEQAQSLFDQNNAVINEMRAEQGMLRRELVEAKTHAARCAEEAAQLRSDNGMLSFTVESGESERERLQEELVSARETSVREAEGARRCEEELSSMREQLASARTAAVEIQAEVAEAKAAKTATDALLDEVRAEVRRLQREAKEESVAAAAREEGLRREAVGLRHRVEELAGEADKLRKDLSGEHSSVNRYKRMVGEIGRLIDWAQASSSMNSAAFAAAAAAAAEVEAETGLGQTNGPLKMKNNDTSGMNQTIPAVRAGGMMATNGKPSPAALAALRVARMSLSSTVNAATATPLHGVVNKKGVHPIPPVVPLSARGKGENVELQQLQQLSALP